MVYDYDMRKRTIGLVVVIISMLSLTACAESPEEQGGSGSEEAAPMVLTIDDSGRSITSQPGDVIEVRLEENPTTGYSWAQEALDETVVRQTSSTYEAPGEALIGQGGMRTLLYEAVGPGTATINLKYWQEWEGDSSVAGRFQVTLTVSE